jgi:hypothetical protein
VKRIMALMFVMRRRIGFKSSVGATFQAFNLDRTPTEIVRCFFGYRICFKFDGNPPIFNGT